MTSSAEALKIAKGRRTIIKASLTRFKNAFREYDKEAPIGSLEARFKKFELLYDQFDEVQGTIYMIFENDEDQRLLQFNERVDFEEQFFCILAEVQAHITKFKQRQLGAQELNESQDKHLTISDVGAHLPMSRLNIKLPTISLPHFDGSYSNWLKFRDTFKSLIHEQPVLTNIQRFHYLQSALSGDAARIIQSLGISDANYELAWKSLQNRYEDSKTLINHHIQELFELLIIKRESYVELRQLIDDVNNNLLALKSLGKPTDSWDSLIVYLLVSKLDTAIKKEWERRAASNPKEPTLKQVTEFLEEHCRYIQKTTVNKTDKLSVAKMNKSTKPGSHTNQFKTSERVASHSITTITCPLCKEAHALYNCEEFRKLPVTARIEQARNTQVCFNCLSPGHRNKTCTFGSCKKCSKKHNTLLHLDTSTTLSGKSPHINAETTANIQNPDSQGTTMRQTVGFVSNQTGQHVLLATALVYVQDSDGNKIECRALLDSGSQVHFMTQALCHRLNLSVTSANTTVSGIEQATHELKHRSQVNLHSRTNNYGAIITCLITPRITDAMPNVPVKTIGLQIPRGVILADPHFDEVREIDLLIGAGLFWDILCVGQIKLDPGQPMLQKTRFGWILTGGMTLPRAAVSTKMACHFITNKMLHDQMAQFWEIEQTTKVRDSLAINAKDPCEQIFRSTTKQDETGRFIVNIPFNDKILKLGTSVEIAEKRLLSLERRLSKEPELKTQYVKFMEEYEDLGHMTEIPIEELQRDTAVYYLPHHAVKKEGSTTTKIRVVFDGSAKTTSGISLNDVQHNGPIVQEELMTIVIGFREYTYVLTADIKQMFRQISVNKDQRDFQRILWRTDTSSPIKHYRLNTVTYGTRPAPFLATRCLRQIGEDNKERYPVTCNTIIRRMYVDDVLTGANTIAEARQLKEELTTLLASGGVELRKWASNDPRILIPSDDVLESKSIKMDKDPKTLGLIWIPESDVLRYSVTPTTVKKVTKRSILSTVSQIFDPLGLVGPAIIRAKIIMQSLWQLQLDWDESLPQDLHTKWIEFEQQLFNLNDIIVPRHVLCKKPVTVELHGFCDASELAYGTCIYLRSIDQEGQCTVRLVCAKSRVAPLKKISLPRLELSGALLLAHLTQRVITALDIKIDKQYFWSDSMIVLAWIKAPSSKWKTFVANRTAEIQELTNDNWNHVVSAENPADIISRGIDPAELKNLQLWWQGPLWLSQNYDNWPSTEADTIDNISEEKKTPHILITTVQTELKIFERYSSLTRLQRVIAFCLRFKENTKKSKDLRNLAELEPEELSHAMTCILKLAQAESFTQEIHEIQKREQVSRSNKLRALNPFIDSQGLFRLGGRLVTLKCHTIRNIQLFCPHNIL